MLKVRIIPTLLYKHHGLVKGVGFDSWRRVGTALPAIKVHNNRQVDELALLDIAATPEGRTIDYEEIDRLADECFMPLSVGGGIRTVEDVRRLLRAGADKVVINTGAFENPTLISDVAMKFGAQCCVCSIDVKRRGPGDYEVWTHSGRTPTGVNLMAWLEQAIRFGAGEILLTSIERDGTFQGYDLELVRMVSEASTVPVIASGGAGNYQHLAAAILEGKASALAMASMYHFTEQTPMEAKRYLRAKGINVRL